jgi:hypothetical protein
VAIDAQPYEQLARWRPARGGAGSNRTAAPGRRFPLAPRRARCATRTDREVAALPFPLGHLTH